MNEIIGYARVSTGSQDLGLQLDALQAAGAKRVFKDVGSGSLRSRPQLDACLERLGNGDTLIVWRLDRLGRSLRHLLTVLAELGERGVAFQSLTEAMTRRPRRDGCRSIYSRRWPSLSAHWARSAPAPVWKLRGRAAGSAAGPPW